MKTLENKKLEYIEEPKLIFGHGQLSENPKDGLMLFGPLEDKRGPSDIRVGVIGRKVGLERYKRWTENIQGYIPAENAEVLHHSSYPGFETIFNTRWPDTPICELEIPDDAINDCLYLSNRHEAIYKTVGLFEEAIRQYLHEEEAHVDLWFVVIPEDIYRLGRPKSVVSLDLRVPSSFSINEKLAQKLQQEPSMFSEINEAAEVYKYELHFHNQLKARLLDNKVIIQVVRETSLTPEDFKTGGHSLRKLQDPATLAWNLTTTCFFKASGRPWKLADIREGVCYVGLVFKRDMTCITEGNACCGAQMFLDSGDGLVFRGAVGPWYSETKKEFHLPYNKAAELIALVIDSYKKSYRTPPKELFIHGRTYYNEEEWRGFQEATPKETNLVGLRIRDGINLKLYGPNNTPVSRGIAFLQGKRKGYLWTKGYIPRLQTYPGREVPNPLSIEICKGETDLLQAMRDIMGLTKVNFNACIYADGYPVTLRFADQVGEILTAAPLSHVLPPLPFKHYI